MARRGRKKWFIGSALVVIVALVALSSVGRGDDGVEARIEEVGREDLVATVTASGQIKPKTQVDVASDITGRILTLHVDEGGWVEKGDLILQIEPTEFEAQVARSEAVLASARASSVQARVNRDQARRTLSRQMQLRETDRNLVSDAELEVAQQNFDVAEAIFESQEHQISQAQAGVQEARQNLSKTVIRAPMTGRVTRRAVDEGEVALASTFSRETGLLVTISDLSTIQIDVRVDETDVVRLELGDSADVSIDAYPDTTFIGRVTRISQSAIQNASTNANERAVDYDVEITLDNPPAEIRPDLSGTARIITETRHDVLAIPIIALALREHTPIATENSPGDTVTRETEGVFVVQNGVAQFRPVKVGIAGEEHFEVLQGLMEGDSIVAGPYQTIRDLTDSTMVRPAPGQNDTNRRAVSRSRPATNPGPASEEQAQPTETVASAPAAAAREPVTTQPAVAPKAYAVQVVAVAKRARAEAMAARLIQTGFDARVVRDDDGLFKVRVGSFPSIAEAQPVIRALLTHVDERPFSVRESTAQVLARGR